MKGYFFQVCWYIVTEDVNNQLAKLTSHQRHICQHWLFWARPTFSFTFSAKTQFASVVISCSRYRGIQMMDSLEYFQPDMFTHVSWRRRCWGARHLVSNGGVLLSTQFGVLLWKTTPILHMMAMCIFIQDTVVAAEPELDQHPFPLIAISATIDINTFSYLIFHIIGYKGLISQAVLLK